MSSVDLPPKKRDCDGSSRSADAEDTMEMGQQFESVNYPA